MGCDVRLMEDAPAQDQSVLSWRFLVRKMHGHCRDVIQVNLKRATRNTLGSYLNLNFSINKSSY